MRSKHFYDDLDVVYEGVCELPHAAAILNILEASHAPLSYGEIRQRIGDGQQDIFPAMEYIGMQQLFAAETLPQGSEPHPYADGIHIQFMLAARGKELVRIMQEAGHDAKIPNTAPPKNGHHKVDLLAASHQAVVGGLTPTMPQTKL